MSYVLSEGKHIVKRELYSGPFTLRELASFFFGTGGKDSAAPNAEPDLPSGSEAIPHQK